MKDKDKIIPTTKFLVCFNPFGGMEWISWLDRGNFEPVGVTLATFKLAQKSHKSIQFFLNWFEIAKKSLITEKNKTNSFQIKIRHLYHKIA